MKRNAFARILAVSIATTGMTSHAGSAAIEALQGAWTMNGTECSDTFEKVGDTIKYKDKAASVTLGLIITGSKIEGPHANCTVVKIQQEKDHLTAHLSCAGAIMLDSYSVSFRIIDAENFVRFDPLFPEAAITYHKCEF